MARLADINRLKLKMKKVARFWALYLLGVGKISWSEKKKAIVFDAVRPQKLILDKDATISEDMEYTGEYLGERKRDLASTLITRFPSQELPIRNKCQDKLGSMLDYTEWWTPEYLFWTMGDIVLGKAMNPHWNEDTVKDSVDARGNPIKVPTPGKNFFDSPKIPYVFLSVFNLGKHPHDDTSLISQNLSLQDLINARHRQINENVKQMNNGNVISGEKTGFNKEEAAAASQALKDGGDIWVPQGDASQAVFRTESTPLAPDVFNQMADTRDSLRNVFGTRGSSPQGTVREQTATGKDLIRNQDVDRISFISDYLEQFADATFNWFQQMRFVYFPDSPLNVPCNISVKEGSMLPRDDLARAQEAVTLAEAKLLDPITMFQRLDYPDPIDAAKKLFLWMQYPMALFPNDKEVSDAVEGAYQASLQEAPMKRVTESVDYKEVPEDIKRQIEERMGFQPSALPPMPDPALLKLQLDAQKNPVQKTPADTLNYQDTPPSVQRQIEAQAGLQPATPQETALQQKKSVMEAQPKPVPNQPNPKK